MQKRFLYLSILAIVFLGCARKRVLVEEVVKPQYRIIQSKKDIQPFRDSLVDPIIYSRVISLNRLPVPEKKQKFVEMLLPAILLVQHELEGEIDRLEEIEQLINQEKQLAHQDSLFLENLYEQYETEDFQLLKEKLQPHPPSIVLGQAALESGWGSSRFFKEGNNVFGIWSYNEEEDRIKALVTRDSVSIYVKRYATIEESIKDYYGTIARVPVYERFRQERLLTQDPYNLIPLLSNYSEMREIYTSTLASLIRDNDLTRFDSYRINPGFLSVRAVELQ